jgi:hypothetical protein
VEKSLRTANKLNIPLDVSFSMAISRLQIRAPHIISTAAECVDRMWGFPMVNEAVNELVQLVASSQEMQQQRSSTDKEEVSPSGSSTIAANSNAHFDGNAAKKKKDEEEAGIVLLTQYFVPRENHTNSVTTQADLDAVLAKNLANPAIKEVYLLNEVAHDFSMMPYSHKIKQYLLGERLTFKAAFLFANEYLLGKTVALGMLCC